MRSIIMMIHNLSLVVMMVYSSSLVLAFHIQHQQHPQQSYNTIYHLHQSLSISSSLPIKRTLKSSLYSSRISTITNNIQNIQNIQTDDDDDDASLIIQALRGRNLNDDDTADAGLQMKLVNIATASSTRSSSTMNDKDTDIETGLPYAYNPIALKEFFQKRPLVVVTRIIQLMNVGGTYVVSLLLDRLLQRNSNDPDIEIQRAIQLRTILTSLGPFYIKIGQALSIRPDVLSPRSMVELQKLCDKVPSYDSQIAFTMFESELGKSVHDIFSDITPEPVAAASLGQVYKATLRDSGDIVAVKIQRPGVLETVSLDLYLAREFGLLARNIPALVQRFDPVALLDEFAYRFYQELDYNLECLNGIRIANDMKVLPMVVIPKNYPQYTTRRVHVAQWIEGEKLSQSTADDVSSLVNLGVITYMTMLLGGAKDANGNDNGGGSGFFHADPHPGNMLRTTDGKLAILDFGLMTEITDDQKYGMIEAIAHLINRDYEEIGQDFINLDFIPKGTDTRPIVPALTKVFDVALAGGGAKSINFQELAADLAEITFEYPFRIPPYFALVIRAISVLEGIALVGNPNFAIIDEAYPYIARRLMTDRSPRLQAALKYMIYGRDGIFDAENAIDLLQALEKFKSVRDDGDGSSFKVNGVRGTKVVGSAGDFRGSQVVDTSDRDADSRFRLSTSNNNNNNNGQLVTTASTSTNRVSSTMVVQDQTQRDQRTVREALRFFFSPEGEVFREFMLEEIVNVVDASGRGAIQELSRSLGLNNFPIPGFVRALYPELTEKDRNIIKQIRILFDFLMGDYYNDTSSLSSTRLRRLIPVAREYAPQLRDFGLILAARLTEKNLSRGMNWATEQLAQREASRRTLFSSRV